uniref:Uncharacterized protein n=1 Tax=Rhizophora mucronata TaxID=61149 RepID=A0A2P2NL62_RHIMU
MKMDFVRKSLAYGFIHTVNITTYFLLFLC